MTRTDTDWHNRARALADRLAAGDVLGSGWRVAFERVPRHAFVPFFYDDLGLRVDSGNPKYLDAVYRDTSLTTQRIRVAGADLVVPTSSSTMPSLMARMLTMLDVADGMRVAEIGTGTGYNVALLCHQLGAENVASIDIDPEIVDAARVRLARLGWHPHLTTGHGRDGIPERAPYDRIIATCAISRIPSPWIGQLAPSGIIVADIRGHLSSSLIALHKTGRDTVEGRFTGHPGHFMWLRALADNPLRDGGDLRTTYGGDNTTECHSDVDLSLFDDPDFRFLLQLYAPTVTGVSPGGDDGTPRLFLTADDGSIATADPEPLGQGGLRIHQTGPLRIWDHVENAVGNWTDLAEPTRDRFGLTATPERHWTWLDNPKHRVP